MKSGLKRNVLKPDIFLAGVAKLADAQASETCGQPYEFKSHRPHQKSRINRIRLFLSIAKAMVYYHALACISLPLGAYHQPIGCILFRNDDIQHFV